MQALILAIFKYNFICMLITFKKIRTIYIIIQAIIGAISNYMCYFWMSVSWLHSNFI